MLKVYNVFTINSIYRIYLLSLMLTVYNVFTVGIFYWVLSSSIPTAILVADAHNAAQVFGQCTCMFFYL